MISILVFDIETRTPSGKPNPDIDIARFVAFYEYETKEYHFIDCKDTEKIKKIFKRHRVIIGFNSKFYDEPILRRQGLIQHWHCHIDIREAIQKRAIDLGVQYEALSLSNLAKCFKISNKQDDFDYSLLNKETLTSEEIEKIKEYTLQDIKVTKEMFDYMHEFFEPFKHYMSKQDIRDFKWLTSSIASYVYKVICYKAGLPEIYTNVLERKPFKGGFVAEPIQGEAHEEDGPIYLWDFNSLYPHNVIQGNLCSDKCICCNQEEKWHGNKLFPVEGYYCSKKPGVIEKVIHDIFKERDILKSNNDRREQALKKIINTFYGDLANPIFASIHNYIRAADCTSIGRCSTIYTREELEKEGYILLYSDTDSIFIQDPFYNLERLIKVIRRIITHIKANLPFPVDTFDISIDAKIKHIWFFYKNNRYLKKHYMYVKDDDTLKVVGLPMIKNDGSRIGLHVFNKYMKERVIQGNIEFTYEEINTWLKIELGTNIEIMLRKFRVWKPEVYTTTSSIQSQISNKYGAGIHWLLPNKYIGVGKSVKYCTIEEFRTKGLQHHALVLNKFWSEMGFFSNFVPGAYKRGKDNSQVALTAWTGF